MRLVKYSFKLIVRRPRLFLGIIIGLVLGLSLISGAFMSVDYFGFASVKKELNKIKVDMVADLIGPYSATIDNYESYKESIEDIDNVLTAEPLLKMYLNGNITYGERSTGKIDFLRNKINLIGVAENRSLSGLEIIEGDFNLAEGEIAMSEDLASLLNVSVGNDITIELRFYNPMLDSMVLERKNLTVGAIIHFSGEYYSILTVEKYYYYYSSMEEYIARYSLVGSIENIYDLAIELFGEYLSELEWSITLSYYVFINRDKVVDPWNLDKTARIVSTIENNIRLALQNKAQEVYIINNIKQVIFMLSIMTTGLKFSLTFQLLPALFLGFLLALLASWLSVNERRREIGLLKLRGARPNDIFMMLSTEAFVAGVIGGALGGLVGYLTAIITIYQLVPSVVQIMAPESFLMHFLYAYVIGSSIVGFILGLIAVFSPAKKVAKLSLLDSLAEYVEEIEKEEKLSRLVYFGIIVGTYGLLEVGLALPVLRFVLTALRGGMFILGFLMIIFMPFEMLAITFGPVFFAYSMAKIISQYSGKLKNIFESMSKIVSRRLSFVAVKNFMRKKARVARVIFLIALTLTFSVYYAINSTTMENRTIIDAKMRIGADIKVDFWYSNPSYDRFLSVYSELKEIEGIKNICRVAQLPLAFSIETQYGSVYSWAYGIDLSYFDISYISNEYLEDVSISEVKSYLKQNNNTLLAISLKRYYGYRKGDTFLINDIQDEVINTTVIGFIKFAPGLLYDLNDLQRRTSGDFFMDIETAISSILKGDTSDVRIVSLLVGVQTGYNESGVAEAIQNVLKENGMTAEITVFKEEIKELRELSFQSVSMFFASVEFIFALAIALVGMTLIMVLAIYERRREIALLIAKGASKRNILGMIAGEAFLITLIAFGLGILVALIYSYGTLVASLNMIGMFQQEFYEYPSGYLMTIPPYLLPTLIVAFIVFIVSSLIPVWLVTKKPISEELRIHH